MAQKYPAFVCSLILLMSSDIVGVITEVYENKGVRNYFENGEADEASDRDEENILD